MTRLALSCLGLGFTLGVSTVALTGQVACASLGFVSGMAFLAVVGISTTACLIWAGRKLGWLKHFTHEHSQHGGD